MNKDKQFYKILKKALKSYHNNNYGLENLSGYKRALFTNGFMHKMINTTKHHIKLKRNKVLLYNKYKNKLAVVYNNLDMYSKAMLIELTCYRLLGYKKS